MRVVIQAGTEAIIWRRIDGILQHSSVNRQRHEIFIRRAQLNFQRVLLVQLSALGWNLPGDFRLGVFRGKCLLKNRSLAPLVPVFAPGIPSSVTQSVDVWSVFCGRLADLSTNGEICVTYLQSWRCKWPRGSGKMISCIYLPGSAPLAFTSLRLLDPHLFVSSFLYFVHRHLYIFL